MKLYIKHVIFPMAVALVCAASCTSDSDPGMSDIEKGEELTFEVKTGTRAFVTNSTNLKATPFMLFGDVIRKGEFHSGLRPLFDKAKVKYENSSWNYGIKQYWQMGQEHSFVAIHPYDVPGLSDLKYDASKVSFTYTLPDTLDQAKDILIATHRRKYTFDSAGSIKFEFKHLLSRINIAPTLHEVLMYDDNPEIQAKDTLYNEYILFHRMEIHGVKTRGAFSFLPKPLPEGLYSTDEYLETFDSDEGQKLETIILDFKEPNQLTNKNQPITILTDKDAVIVLPQSFADDSESKIILTYTVNDDEPLRTITIPLKNTTWETGKTYTYKFTIEKAYTGQIKPGSLEIEADDFRLPEVNDNEWINGGENITYDFSENGTIIN